MSPWGWKPERTQGIWRYGAAWMRPFVAGAPYLTVVVLLLMLHFVGGTFVSARGLALDLPEAGLSESDREGAVALVMPMTHGTMVFFDDSRYLLGDSASLRTFGEHLADRLGRSESKTLLVLADRRVPGGELMGLAKVAKGSGVERLLFAEKREASRE